MLAGAFDDAKAGSTFFKNIVSPLQDIQDADYDKVVLSTYLRRGEVYRKLIENMVSEEKILAIYDVPTVK